LSPVKTNAVINITSLSETNVASQQWSTFLEVISRSQQLNGKSISTTINIIIISTCVIGKNENMKVAVKILRDEVVEGKERAYPILATIKAFKDKKVHIYYYVIVNIVINIYIRLLRVLNEVH